MNPIRPLLFKPTDDTEAIRITKLDDLGIDEVIYFYDGVLKTHLPVGAIQIDKLVDKKLFIKNNDKYEEFGLILQEKVPIKPSKKPEQDASVQIHEYMEALWDKHNDNLVVQDEQPKSSKLKKTTGEVKTGIEKMLQLVPGEELITVDDIPKKTTKKPLAKKKAVLPTQLPAFVKGSTKFTYVEPPQKSEKPVDYKKVTDIYNNGVQEVDYEYFGIIDTKNPSQKLITGKLGVIMSKLQNVGNILNIYFRQGNSDELLQFNTKNIEKYLKTEPVNLVYKDAKNIMKDLGRLSIKLITIEDLLNLDDKTRSIVKKNLSEYFSNSEDLETALYNQYNNDVNNYYKQLITLLLFINPNNFLGKFANTFQTKVAGDIYSADRLAKLSVFEMLPEVFLNINTNDRRKLDVYENITAVINENLLEFADKVKFLKNPGITMKARPVKHMLPTTEKMIESSVLHDITDLCINPYWETKRANIIVCKSKGSFYCLNIEELLREFVSKNKMTNKYTGESLNAEIVNNMKTRFANEINSIRKGESVSIGGDYTSVEIDKLRKLLTNLNKVLVALGDDLFGDISDISEVGKYIPKTVIDKYTDEGVEKFKVWLNENILNIEDTINEYEMNQALAPTVEKTTEVSVPTVVEKSVVPFKKQLITPEEEHIRKYVTIPNKMTTKIFQNLIDRLNMGMKVVLDKLNKTSDITSRNELATLMKNINSELSNLRLNNKTYQGILLVLNDMKKFQLKRLNNIKHGLDTMAILPTETGIAQDEYNNINKYISQLDKEIANINTIYNNFVKSVEQPQQNQVQSLSDRLKQSVQAQAFKPSSQLQIEDYNPKRNLVVYDDLTPSPVKPQSDSVQLKPSQSLRDRLKQSVQAQAFKPSSQLQIEDSLLNQDYNPKRNLVVYDDLIPSPVKPKSDSVQVKSKSDSVQVKSKSDSVQVKSKSDSVQVKPKSDSVQVKPSQSLRDRLKQSIQAQSSQSSPFKSVPDITTLARNYFRNLNVTQKLVDWKTQHNNIKKQLTNVLITYYPHVDVLQFEKYWGRLTNIMDNYDPKLNKAKFASEVKNMLNYLKEIQYSKDVFGTPQDYEVDDETGEEFLSMTTQSNRTPVSTFRGSSGVTLI
jgi:hypothetical protein